MQINITLEAEKLQNCEIIVFASNTDAGGKEIIDALKEKNFVFISNMISEDFLSLMSVANVMVGNSSAAIKKLQILIFPQSILELGNKGDCEQKMLLM